MRHIEILDTTLRDGEQTPGVRFSLSHKIEIAKQLDRMGVDCIEAGFPASSKGDFDAVAAISREVSCSVQALARATKNDIDCAAEALKEAKSPIIHVFLATSDLHLEYKLKMTREEALSHIKEAVSYAKSLCKRVQFSPEDATRSDREYLAMAVKCAVDAGADIINIPDTVGYTVPTEYADLVRYLLSNVEGLSERVLCIHCHNDLGLAVANSICAVEAGALRVECTVNGLGERAGNASLEEVVMALRVRRDVLGADTAVNTKEILRTSRMVSSLTGLDIALNKPVVGSNAFAHESGIHQHGVLANKSTYEIMTPESVGIQKNQMVLGKHSGKHAFSERLKELGYELGDDQIVDAFSKFKELCDKKKTVTDGDIEALVNNTEIVDGKYKLVSFDVKTMGKVGVCSSICLKHEDEFVEQQSLGDGAIDALYAAIDKIVQPPEHVLDKFNISAVSEGQDTLGEVTLKLNCEGKTYSGRGLSTDIIEAGIMAYLNAINKLMQ